jgi:hypothetical protein
VEGGGDATASCAGDGFRVIEVEYSKFFQPARLLARSNNRSTHNRNRAAVSAVLREGTQNDFENSDSLFDGTVEFPVRRSWSARDCHGS